MKTKSYLQEMIPKNLILEVLGYSLSDCDVQQVFQAIQIVNHEVRKEFWNSANGQPGIYIIMTGRVRLVDRHNNLLTSIEKGMTFGEDTLFPETLYLDYRVRTAQDAVTVCFIPATVLQSLYQRYPELKAHLYYKAQEIWSFLLHPRATVQQLATQLVDVSSTPNLKTQQQQKYSTSAKFPKPSLRRKHFWQRIIRRYPFVAQQSGSDCGVACLSMIAQYWGKRFTINYLRSRINTDRNGASLRRLISGAESLGFSARPVKASFTALRNLQLPAIVHWEGIHYIVLYAVTHRYVIVADPMIGQKKLSHATFQKGWTGYLLLLQPTEQFSKTAEDITDLGLFRQLVQPHWPVIAEVVIASILIQLFGLVTPLFTQLLLDRVVVQGSFLTLHTVGIGLLIFGFFRVALTGFRQYLLDHTANKVDLALITGFIRQTFRLPLNFFETRYVGDIISRIQENKKIQRFLTSEALSVLLDMLTLFIYLGLMFWYSWKLALFTLIIVPPYMFIALLAMPFLQRVSREIFKASSIEIGYLIQALTGARTVKSMSIEHPVRWHWEDLLDQSLKKNFAGQVVSNSLQISSAVIETTVTTGLLWLGGWLVIQQELTIGQLVAFNMLLGNVMAPFRRLSVLWNELQEVVIAVERINDVMEAEPEETFQSAGQVLPPLRNHTKISYVTF
jgi:ABC-type bacteriocin/lantibiotic exporter with double-glycine peptidase domain